MIRTLKTRRWPGSAQGAAALVVAGGLFLGGAVAAFAQGAQTYNVRLVNFAIEGAPAQVRPGTPITFNAASTGFPHSLAIDGNGVDIPPPGPNLMDGQSGSYTFAPLQPGTYTLYCPVGRHREQGMAVSMTVVAGAASLPTSGGAVRFPTLGGLSLPAALSLTGLASAAAGICLRRRSG